MQFGSDLSSPSAWRWPACWRPFCCTFPSPHWCILKRGEAERGHCRNMCSYSPMSEFIRGSHATSVDSLFRERNMSKSCIKRLSLQTFPPKQRQHLCLCFFRSTHLYSTRFNLNEGGGKGIILVVSATLAWFLISTLRRETSCSFSAPEMYCLYRIAHSVCVVPQKSVNVASSSAVTAYDFCLFWDWV